MKENKKYFLSKKLDLDQEKIDRGFKREIIKEEKSHYRIDKRYGGLEKGTCVFKNGEIVKGYPKMRRALTLTPTIQKRFGRKIAVEEKLNGYNVRITTIEGETIALTRSGLICPYTTAKAKKKMNKEFFEKNPEKIIYGEMIGPDNPYVPTDIYDIDSLDFFVFDIRKKETGKKLTVKKRRKLCDKFKLNKVKLFDYLDSKNSFHRIKEIIKELGEKKREGIVIKDPLTELEPIKYTTSQSNCKDLNYAYRFYQDYGSDFVYPRTVREGFQSFEWDETMDEREERAKRIGLNILNPMLKTIKEKKEGKKITESVHLKVRELETAKKFIDHLNKQGINTEVTEIKELGEKYKVFIDKLQKSTNDKTEHLLNGGLW